MSDDLQVSVSSPEEATELREQFEEVIARVNGDLFGQSVDSQDPMSIERVVMQAEQSVTFHLSAFAENRTLQALAPEIKERFAQSIRDQSQRGAGTSG